MAIGIEDMIYVAVGKEVKEFKSILLWALQNSGGKPICILHVHQPAQLIPISKSQIQMHVMFSAGVLYLMKLHLFSSQEFGFSCLIFSILKWDLFEFFPS